MKCLWLTLADPDPPMNGQFLYSSGLIRAAAAAGMELDVVGFSLPGGSHRDGDQTGGISWHLAPHRPRSRWSGLISYLPGIVDRTQTRYLRGLVGDMLEQQQWDAIVVDSISLAWAVSLVLRGNGVRQDTAKLVYLAHNHEATLASRVAQQEKRRVKRYYKYIDAVKMAALERAVSRHCVMIGSNTPDDCEKFRRRWPDKAIEFLPPGYSGPRVVERKITAGVPRRAIIVGSFDWVAKRQSLEEFLCAADPLFAREGVELYVVGQADHSFLDRLRKTCRATHFTGRVEDVAIYMKDARIALVPDRVAGFKLKGLDYVFNRLPIFAMEESLPGMPLHNGQSIEFYADHAKLAEGVVRRIDDYTHLNALQEQAYDACHDRFDWQAIGQLLRSAIARAGNSCAEMSLVGDLAEAVPDPEA